MEHNKIKQSTLKHNKQKTWHIVAQQFVAQHFEAQHFVEQHIEAQQKPSTFQCNTATKAQHIIGQDNKAKNIYAHKQSTAH